MKEMQPIITKSTAEKVADRICKMIESGALKAGDRLPPEPEFAQQMGVSRGILREGLAHLKAIGIITRKPKDGTYIRDAVIEDGILVTGASRAMEVASYRNLLDMRDAIEQKAVAMAIDLATDEELDGLLAMAAEPLSDEALDDLDFYFHYRLVELSHNTIFMQLIDLYFGKIMRIRSQNLYIPLRRCEVEAEHYAIASAMHRRDKEGAKHAIHQHMKNILANILTNGTEGESVTINV